MKKISGILLILTICTSLVFMLAGCGESSPIAGGVISNEQYTDQSAIDKAPKPTALTKDKDIYASVSFIESPKGMKYTAKWLINAKEIKTDEKKMTTDKRGILVFPLERDKLKGGSLKLQITYKDNVLMEKEILVK